MELHTFVLTIETDDPDENVRTIQEVIRRHVAGMGEDISPDGNHRVHIVVTTPDSVPVTELDYEPEEG